jgi:hypothetical protein
MIEMTDTTAMIITDTVGEDNLSPYKRVSKIDTLFFLLIFLKKEINNQTLTFHLNTLQKYN